MISMLSNYKKIFIVCSILLATQLLLPQSKNLKFDNIGLEQGLSQSTVYSIAQDAQGFMWFGTQDGLNRYDGYSVKVFRNNPADPNTIADNEINCLLVGLKGDLWIGTTRSGLDRYVPSENKFYHYRGKNGDETTISGNNVTSLFKDSDGNIWVGTSNNGLTLFNYSTETFRHYQLDEKKSAVLSNNIIWAIREDHKRNLWIAAEQGLYKMNLDEQIKISVVQRFDLNLPNLTKPNALSSIRALHVDHNGVLWVGTINKGIYRYEQEHNLFKHYSKGINAIQTIFEDSKGNLWVGSIDSGIVIFDSHTDRLIRDKDALNIQSLSNTPIYSIYEDKAGTLWFGTLMDGVYKRDWRKNRFKHYYDDPNNSYSMKGNVVIAILKDRNNELWVGTFDNGLNRFNRTRDKIINYSFDTRNPNSLSSNRVMALCESSDGNLWVGTYGGGLNRFDRTSGTFKHYHSNKYITRIYEDSKGYLWIGSTIGIERFNPTTNTFVKYYIDEKNLRGLTGSIVLTIYQDVSGSIWVGTLNGGLHCFDEDSNSFKKYKLLSETKQHKIDSESITSVQTIYQKDSTILWVGTVGNGLIRYDAVTNVSNYFTEADGLPNNTVYGILHDKLGNLWLSTNKGISRFNPKIKSFRNYDVKDGLQSNEFNQGAYFLSLDGEMFFGGMNGFNSFFPGEIVDNKYIPPVYISNLKVFDKMLPLPNPIPTGKHIELSFSQNFFSFEFVALNYTSSEKNQYAYILEDFDKDWHIVSASQRYASYTNLDPGEYVLRVKASNNDGVWNETGTTIAITIVPPFWMTWWFRTLFVVIVLLFITGSIRHFIQKKISDRTRKIEQETAIERERLRIARDMHDDLGAKVTQISILSELAKRDIEKKKPIQNYVEDISIIGKRVVNALDEIVWSVNPKNDTLESLLDYIIQHMEQFLTQAGINYRLDIIPDIPSIPVQFDIRHNLFMVMQETLNNTVKHAHATEVKFKTKIEKAKLILSLRDNGQGFDLSSYNTSGASQINKNRMNMFSNGLENMKKRIEEIGGNFSVISSKGHGTEIFIEISLVHNKNKTVIK